MKVAGSSRKDGMTLYGPHYKVNVTVPEPGAEPVVEVKEHKSGEAVTRTKEIPILRGMASLILNNGPIAAALGLQLLAEVQEARGKKHGLLTLAEIALTGFIFYRTAGDIKTLRKFHGAEHMVIGAQEQGLPNEIDRVRTVSRVNDRCGTNFVGFYLPASVLASLLPLPSETLKAVAAMGIAYEGFKLDRKKYGKYVEPFYKIGSLAQEHITTAEPDQEQLEAAILAMEALLKAEKGVSSQKK